MANSVEPGAALSIGLADSLLPGEVRHCRAEANGYLVAVELHHSLGGLAELNRSVQKFVDDGATAAIENASSAEIAALRAELPRTQDRV
jgi:hypothetical protein